MTILCSVCAAQKSPILSALCGTPNAWWKCLNTLNICWTVNPWLEFIHDKWETTPSPHLLKTGESSVFKALIESWSARLRWINFLFWLTWYSIVLSWRVARRIYSSHHFSRTTDRAKHRVGAVSTVPLKCNNEQWSILLSVLDLTSRSSNENQK